MGLDGELPAPQCWLPVLIVALILGLLWDRYRRIIPLIALHWGIDLLPAVAGMLGISR